MKQVSTLLSMLKPLMDRDTSWDLMMAKNHLIFDRVQIFHNILQTMARFISFGTAMFGVF